jgi:hypothetical protein
MTKNTSASLIFAALVLSSCQGFLTQPGTAATKPTFLLAPLHSSSPKNEAPPSSGSTALKTPPKDTPASPLVLNMETAKELLDEIAMNEKEEHNLLVVKYHTNYCKLCKRANLTYKKIASEWSKRLKGPKPDHIKTKVEEIRFIRVETTKIDKERTRELGISQFPYVQIYRRGECVASFATGPEKQFQLSVRDSVNFFAMQSEEDDTTFSKDFSAEIEKKKAALQNLAIWAQENE